MVIKEGVNEIGKERVFDKPYDATDAIQGMKARNK
jgi:hypothetical protein